MTRWTSAGQASLSITNSQSLLKLTSIELVMPSNHLIFCHPLLPASIFPSIRVFSNESGLSIGWPKYWSFSFSISPSNEYLGLISFRIDWFDLLAVEGTFYFFFAFCHKGDVIFISEVIDISPDNLNSSLCFIQPIISHHVLCI